MCAIDMAEATSQPLHAVRFRLAGERIPGASWVALVGPFNRWDAAVHRLALGADGWWTIFITLPPGTHPYLFIVDGFPYNDPEDDGRVPCEWGGWYSVCVVC